MAKKGKYYVRPDGLHESIRTINGRRVAFRGKSDREVDQKILQYTEKMQRGRTVRQLVDAWLKDKEAKIADASQVAYRAPAHRLADALGDKWVKDIEPIHLVRILENMKAKGFALGAVKLQKTVILQVFRFAVIQGDIDVSPASEIELPRGLPHTQRGSLDEEQIKSVMQYRGPGYLLGLLLMFTGCRRGELMALRWEDIDRKAGFITIDKKVSYANGKPILEDHAKTEAGMRKIPLVSPLADALPKDRIGLIFHRQDGGYLTQNDVAKLWREFCDGVGLYITETVHAKNTDIQVRKYPYTPHWMRHTFATICYDAEVDFKSAASILGHANEKTTLEIYTHLSKSREQSAAQKLDAFVSQQKEKAAE